MKLENELENKKNSAMIIGEKGKSVVDTYALKGAIKSLIVNYGVTDFYSDDESELALETAKILRRHKKKNPQIMHHLVLSPWRERPKGKYAADSVLILKEWVSRVPNVLAVHQYMTEQCSYAISNVRTEDSVYYYAEIYAKVMNLKIFNIF